MIGYPERNEGTHTSLRPLDSFSYLHGVVLHGEESGGMVYEIHERW